jgi:hypothetical protein
MWLNDPQIYTGGSVTTGRASHARQVKGDNQNKKGYPGPPGWELGVWLQTPSRKKSFVEKILKLDKSFWKRLGSTEECNASRGRRRRG